MGGILEIFTEGFGRIASLLAIVGVLGALALLLRQPLVVAFLVAGIVGGPAVLGLVEHSEELDLLAELGIAILLFLVGLKLDLGIIRTMGPVALLTGMGQVVFTSVFGFLIALGLGWSVVASVYIAVALTFSSTIIIVKLLSDKRELDALHGRVAVGFLIVQDLVVILALILLPTLDAGGQGAGAAVIARELGWLAVKATLFVAFLAAVMRWVIPRAARLLARSTELLLLAAIAWAVGLSVAGDALGFSKEVGAFVAGVTLAGTPFRESIGGRLVPLRDFLLVFFFINLGATLELATLGEQLAPALIFSAFVLIGNPLVVMAIMGLMGYRKRTGFLAGLTVAQISEFSLILTAMGVSLGHVGQDTLALVTLVGMVTIGLSTYMIMYSGWLYERLAPWLTIFERANPVREAGQDSASPVAPDVVLIGIGRYGGRIGRRLIERGLRVFAVDFDPSALKAWNAEGRSGQYGDATDPELCASLPLRTARLVVCSSPDERTNRTLLQALRESGYTGKYAGTAHNPREARALRKLGADLVLEPFANAADEAADLLTPLTVDGPLDGERSQGEATA
ncbi:MAG: cation:proton antiporter [Phycisphaeraceae bacterium]|nr:cation:proton antiporter [Phycisphaeraceae bacterium]